MSFFPQSKRNEGFWWKHCRVFLHMDFNGNFFQWFWIIPDDEKGSYNDPDERSWLSCSDSFIKMNESFSESTRSFRSLLWLNELNDIKKRFVHFDKWVRTGESRTRITEQSKATIWAHKTYIKIERSFHLIRPLLSEIV